MRMYIACQTAGGAYGAAEIELFPVNKTETEMFLKTDGSIQRYILILIHIFPSVKPFTAFRLVFTQTKPMLHAVPARDYN